MFFRSEMQVLTRHDWQIRFETGVTWFQSELLQREAV